MVYQIKQIEGFPDYEIDTEGNIFSNKFGKKRMKKQTLTKHGYFIIGLTNKSEKTKVFNVHKIIGKTFLANPNNYRCICHNDSNSQNNKIENLRWDTHKNNTRDSILAGRWIVGEMHKLSKLNRLQVLEILAMKGSKNTSVEIAKIFKVSPSTIQRIFHGKLWRHLINPKSKIP